MKRTGENTVDFYKQTIMTATVNINLAYLLFKVKYSDSIPHRTNHRISVTCKI